MCTQGMQQLPEADMCDWLTMCCRDCRSGAQPLGPLMPWSPARSPAAAWTAWPRETPAQRQARSRKQTRVIRRSTASCSSGGTAMDESLALSTADSSATASLPCSRHCRSASQSLQSGQRRASCARLDGRWHGHWRMRRCKACSKLCQIVCKTCSHTLRWTGLSMKFKGCVLGCIYEG